MSQAQSGLGDVSRASRQYPWRQVGDSRTPVTVASAVSVLAAAHWHRPSAWVAPAVSTRNHRRARCQRRRPSVPTAAQRPLNAQRSVPILRQLLGPSTCPRCILHGSIRVGQGRIVVSLIRALRTVLRGVCGVGMDRGRTKHAVPLRGGPCLDHAARGSALRESKFQMQLT